MQKLRCVVERITYQNPENGYSVMRVKVKGYSDLVTLVGNLLEVPAGSVLLCEGEWKVDKRYGNQFVAQSWEEVMPATIYGIEKYLGSGLVKGIGPKFAQLIVSRFGLETIDVIETDIERLYEVPGIGKKRVEKIAESWEKQKDIKNVMLFLQGYGVSTAYAAKIYRQYGKESIDTVKSNPYKLADDIWGIGFKTADGIAAKMGYEKNDLRRCKSGITLHAQPPFRGRTRLCGGGTIAQSGCRIARSRGSVHPSGNSGNAPERRPDSGCGSPLYAAVLLCRGGYGKPPGQPAEPHGRQPVPEDARHGENL